MTGVRSGDDVRYRTRTGDLDEAEQVLAQLYLPVRIMPAQAAVDMRLDALRLETMTAGRLSYGHDVRLDTAMKGSPSAADLRGAIVELQSGDTVVVP